MHREKRRTLYEKVSSRPYFVGLALLLVLGLTSEARAQAECQPGDEDQFAVFVMPDTQKYVDGVSNNPYLVSEVAAFEEEGAKHLDSVMQWLCQHKDGWVEPSTGSCMRIELLVHLGDIVEHQEFTNSTHLWSMEDPDLAGSCSQLNAGSDPEVCTCAGNLCQWRRASAAFDILDACGMRYLTVPGNHDMDGIGDGEAYTTFFGEQSPYRGGSQLSERCASADNCDWEAGEWYLGGGAEPGAGPSESDEPAGEWIEANGRGSDGPSIDQAGRNRAGIIRSPGGSEFLFLGLDQTLSRGVEYSHRWPEQLMGSYAGVPTILFSHYGIGDGTFVSTTSDGVKSAFQTLVADQEQVFLMFNGHSCCDVDRPYPIEGGPSLPFQYHVPRVQRNYQWEQYSTGPPRFGRNVIAVIDNEKHEVRVRSYFIGGEPPPLPQPATVDGVPGRLVADFGPPAAQPTVPGCSDEPNDTDPLDGSQSAASSRPPCSSFSSGTLGVPERVYPLPELPRYPEDTCQDLYNPATDPAAPGQGQYDSDADGYGDLCDNCPQIWNSTQANTDGSGLGDACNLDADGDEIDDAVDRCVAPNSWAENLDVDRDGYGEACDPCPDLPEVPLQFPGDADGDGIGDSCDYCPNVSSSAEDNADSDGDGHGFVCDNCPATANPNQLDADEDGLGDACDLCVDLPQIVVSDTDSDGVGNICDNCPDYPNPDQADTDEDDIGDACDSSDHDGDSVEDRVDNCNATPNVDQRDSDGDDQGDRCDDDLDGDGIPNSADSDLDGDGYANQIDRCPRLPVPDASDQIDSDGDGHGDLCDLCPTLTAIPQSDSRDTDLDDVGDACDNCLERSNPRVVAGAQSAPWTDPALSTYRTTTGGQLDDDADGVGNACDADFNDNGFIDSDDRTSLFAAVWFRKTVSDEDCHHYDGATPIAQLPCDVFDLTATSEQIDGDSVREFDEISALGAPELCEECPGDCEGDACDPDQDGVPSYLDNCTFVPNPNQEDGDLDGYGSLCDGDCNATPDYIHSFSDYPILGRSFFKQTPPNGPAHPCFDLNDDGWVNPFDWILVWPRWHQEVGPSGLTCAGQWSDANGDGVNDDACVAP